MSRKKPSWFARVRRGCWLQAVLWQAPGIPFEGQASGFHAQVVKS
ncbi:hypothetical protein [Acetobacter orleanensis]|nr:hypothetical protein [Acetobacter orleanensis]